MRGKRFLLSIPAILLATALIAGPAVTGAQESAFRKQFTMSYENERFDYLAILIKQNKSIVPQEIETIIKEALAPEQTFQEKMHLLDLANTMASMYKHWFEDGKPLEKVEALQAEELKKEEARKAELEKWNNYEKFLGNVLMRTNPKLLEAKGVTPVLFPHWVHNLLYECKACHPGAFSLKKGTNSINHASMQAGKTCGACHDGKTSFGANEQCDRCHSTGKPDEERMTAPKKADLKKLKEAADRVGAAFRPEKLSKGFISMDRFGSVDWALLKKDGAWEPAKSINKVSYEMKRDTVIQYEPAMAYIKSVTFSHGSHTQVTCSSCHDEVYKKELGADKATMTDMSKGQSCGACHNKVAFRFADCNRCHNQQNGVPVPGALARPKK